MPVDQPTDEFLRSADVAMRRRYIGLVTFHLPQRQGWNPEGHQIVGAVANAMLTPNAKQQVAALLGVTLSTAGPWVDCVKSVHKFADVSVATCGVRPTRISLRSCGLRATA
jgi:hypothetical protein